MKKVGEKLSLILDMQFKEKRGLILREDIVSANANFLLLPIPFFVQIIISDIDMQPWLLSMMYRSKSSVVERMASLRISGSGTILSS